MILACFMYDCGLGYLGMFYVCMLGTVLWCPTACRCVLAVALDMPTIDIGTCAKSFSPFVHYWCWWHILAVLTG